jgi:hypothetical protein
MDRARKRYVGAVVAILALGAFSTPALAAANVVLGAAAFAPNGTGWGTAEPEEIFNGGDPSGLVTEIHWRGWGGQSATGWGRTSIFKPHGGYYRKQVRLELRASGLGHCGAQQAYTQLSVRGPSRPGGPLGPWGRWSDSPTICKYP